MYPAVRLMILVSICFPVSQVAHAQTNIEFDVPAVASATETSTPTLSGDKIIEIRLPISSAVDQKYRRKIDEFRFDVSWNRSVYSIVDFGPRTKLVSEVEGLMNVEKNSTRNAGISLGLSSKAFELTTANIATDVGGSESIRQTYQEIPQQEVLVASGTIDRGTGAFFRFHPSRINSIEGSHEILLRYRVPDGWKSGLLKVECRATGKKSVIGLWEEPFETGLSFVVPVYLDESSSAQRLAINFAKAEQDLRKAWLGYQSELKRANPFEKAITFTRCNSQKLPEKWPHLLIQSGDDRYLSEFEGYLTQEVAVAAGKFVQARSSLDGR